jgi:type IV secretion system protein VirB9
MKSIFLVALLALPAYSAKLPAPSRDDPYIRYVRYDRDDVTVIHVQRGTVTRIVLAPEEKIIKDGSATGFPSDCSKPELEWCIRADVGTNQVLVKPKDGATHNNIELRTNLRDYSFALQVLPDTKQSPHLGQSASAAKTKRPMYRVIFTYPPDGLATAAALARLAALTGGSTIAVATPASSRPVAKNWKYTMQIIGASGDIAPSLAFDDGRFTYLRFPANREIPTVFAVSPQGEESRVNFHMDPADSSLIAVERMGRRFVLRLGNSTVGIWNEAFDPNGVPPSDGTTVAGVARVLREGK